MRGRRRAVLDASAVLAFVFDEPGAERVEGAVVDSIVATVNWAEVWQRLLARGAPAAEVRDRLLEAGMALEPLTPDDGERAGALAALTRPAGLSLADRCCLAVAQRLDCPALTADEAWTSVALEVEVVLIR